MSHTQSFISQGTRRALGCALIAACLFLTAGCGQNDPLVELRDLGAEFKRTRERTVEIVRLPKSAGDEALGYVAQLRRPDAVTLLDLSGTEVTDEGLAHLEKLTGLKTLDLTDTEITDEGLKHLEHLAELRDLRVGETQITGEGLIALVDSLPNLAALDVKGKGVPTPPEPRSWKSALNFGIDLAGGTNLVYQVDRQAIEDKIRELEDQEGSGAMGDVDDRVTGEVMDQMVAAVSRRLNPSGVEEITVRKVGSDRIEVIIPKASPEVVEQKKRQMTRLGSLEFAMLANSRDHREIFTEIEKPGNLNKDLHREDGTLLAGWRPIGVNANGTPKEVGVSGEIYSKPITVNGQEILHFLTVFGRPEQRVTGEFLSRAYETTDENGRLAVGFMFNSQGGYRFQQLTSTNLPLSDGFRRRLAILLDNRVHSAPSIESTISNQGQITGSFTQEEIQELIGVLNAGALTVPIQQEPVSEFSVSPLLGEEVQRSGITAILVAGGVVLVFMLGYYLFAGLVANFCLVLNLILIMGAMALIDATFTLPGLAGIVLTIGMAVDANVLIFERMREELNRGASLRMAIQNGYGRAFSAIIDSNLTTLITAVVLYIIGTDQVRGFAVTLFIGIVMSLFTALFFGRMVFDIAERKRWITSLPMLSIIPPNTRWRFIRYWKPVVLVTGLLMVVGLGVFVARGQDNFDIDFSGGTMLTFELTEDQETSDVREALESYFPDEAITLERLTRADLPEDSDSKGRLFRVRTKRSDVDKVAEDVTDAMQVANFSLKRLEMTPGPAEIDKSIQPISQEEIAAANANTDLSDFAGGHRIELKFPSGLAKSELETHFTDAMRSLEDDGQPKYSNLDDLVFFNYPEDASPTSEQSAGRISQAAIWVSPDVARADFEEALQTLQEPQFEGKNSFASSVADEMKVSAVQAILLSMVAMVAYLWFRFESVTFGIAAVLSLIHDVLMTIAILATVSYAASNWGISFLGLEDFKINLPMVAALMTLVGYSVNDTIVMFDRVREVRGKNPALTEDMVNVSINQTLSRTILTSMTTWFVVIILYFLGGSGIHGFAFALVVGIVIGTYSSIYISCPALLWMMNRNVKSAKPQATQPSKATAAG